MKVWHYHSQCYVSRHHVDVVLPVAAHAAAVAAIGHAELAGSSVHLAGALGLRRHRLLPDPDRAGGGSRHAGDGVNLSEGVHGFAVDASSRPTLW
jgi:hypothetical protein